MKRSVFLLRQVVQIRQFSDRPAPNIRNKRTNVRLPLCRIPIKKTAGTRCIKIRNFSIGTNGFFVY